MRGIATCAIIAAGTALSTVVAVRYFGWPLALIAGPLGFAAGWSIGALFDIGGDGTRN
jgi:hypothetical protein